MGRQLGLLLVRHADLTQTETKHPRCINLRGSPANLDDALPRPRPATGHSVNTLTTRLLGANIQSTRQKR